MFTHTARMNKEITIGEKEFVAIINGKPYHSNSWFDLDSFFSEYDYIQELNEIISSKFDLFAIFTRCCEQMPELWAQARGDTIPHIWELYTQAITERADYIILAKKKEGE